MPSSQIRFALAGRTCAPKRRNSEGRRDRRRRRPCSWRAEVRHWSALNALIEGKCQHAGCASVAWRILTHALGRLCCALSATDEAVVLCSCAWCGANGCARMWFTHLFVHFLRLAACACVFPTKTHEHNQSCIFPVRLLAYFSTLNMYANTTWSWRVNEMKSRILSRIRCKCSRVRVCVRD